MSQQKGNQPKPKTNRSYSDSASCQSKSSLDLAAEEILASSQVDQGTGLFQGKKRTASVDSATLRNTSIISTQHHQKPLQQQQTINNTHMSLVQLQELLSVNKSKTELAEINKALSALQSLQVAPSSTIFVPATQSQKNVSPLKSTPMVVPQLPSQMSSRISQMHTISNHQQTAIGTTDIVNLMAPQQQMLLLQLVNQNKTNPSLISTIQAPSHTVTTGKFLISQTPSPLQTIALQKTQQQHWTTSGSSRPVNIAPSVKNTLQYVVSPTGTLTIQQPLVRYVSQPSSPVSLLSLTTKNTSNKNYLPLTKQSATGVATTTSNYVRIAPATDKPCVAAINGDILSNVIATNPLELENEKQRRNLMASMNQHIMDKNMDSQRVYDTIPAARQFINNMVNEEFIKKIKKNKTSPSTTTERSSPGTNLDGHLGIMIMTYLYFGYGFYKLTFKTECFMRKFSTLLFICIKDQFRF